MDRTEFSAVAKTAPSAAENTSPPAALVEDLHTYCGADAAKWAEQFRTMAIKLGYSDMDEGWLIGWFANAIERAEQVRHPPGLASSGGKEERDALREALEDARKELVAGCAFAGRGQPGEVAPYPSLSKRMFDASERARIALAGAALPPEGRTTS